MVQDKVDMDAPETSLDESMIEEKMEEEICSKNKFIEGVEDVFQDITSNIELILGTIVAVFLQAISAILSGGSTGESMDFNILLTVLEFIIGPFIMLIVFKIINEKINDKMKRISEKYRESIISLSNANSDLRTEKFLHRISMDKAESEYKLDIERLRYTKDIEIAQLKTALETKNIENSILNSEIDKLNKEIELRTNC